MALFLFVFKIGIALFIGIFLGVLFMGDVKAQLKRKYETVRNSSYEKVEASAEKKLAYDVMEEKMYRLGIKFRMGARFGPFDYMVFRMLSGVGLGIVGILYKPWCFIPGFVGGFLLVSFYFNQKNKDDNEDMLPDIAKMNSIVALQMKSGVHISKVVYECCRDIGNPRLKQALLELSIDLENFATIQQAAVQFNKKFSNQHIDSFAKTLEQLQDTGSSIAFFEDAVASVEAINDAIALRDEHKAKQVGGFFQVLLFLGPLIFVFYMLFGMFSGSGGMW